MYCVQRKPKNPAQKKRKGRRIRAEKVDRLQYIIQRIGRPEQKIDGVDLRMRTMMDGLRDWMSFKSNCIQRVACQDEVDTEIIERLVQADDGGVLPSVIARNLSRYRLRCWDITRRIQHMNKKLREELGMPVAEKRGHRWACLASCETLGEEYDEAMLRPMRKKWKKYLSKEQRRLLRRVVKGLGKIHLSRHRNNT